MSATPRREIGLIDAPYGRRIKLDEVVFDSGMTLLRVTIREGSRYTILEIDPASAQSWGALMRDWAEAQQGDAHQ
jgi:hypothetical protein